MPRKSNIVLHKSKIVNRNSLFQVEKFQVEKFQVEKFQVEKFQVEKFQVEKFQVQLDFNVNQFVD